MVVIEVIIALAIWFASGHAISKIYFKAGFKDTPIFVFLDSGIELGIFVLFSFLRMA
ncbi:hypothetical protein ATS73_006415 [Pseudoalteromonas sp. H100]|nr:hypothetical protein [Pseudoalteromonas sp. H100]WFO20289.1 hypothetical protein ATS73_006415 [Pseudoalteromonas sp. H100]